MNQKSAGVGSRMAGRSPLGRSLAPLSPASRNKASTCLPLGRLARAMTGEQHQRSMTRRQLPEAPSSLTFNLHDTTTLPSGKPPVNRRCIWKSQSWPNIIEATESPGIPNAPMPHTLARLLLARAWSWCPSACLAIMALIRWGNQSRREQAHHRKQSEGGSRL